MHIKLFKLIVYITVLSACEQHETAHPDDETGMQTEFNIDNKTELDYELDALRLMPFLAVHDDPIAAAWLSLQDHPEQADYQPTPANIAQYEKRLQTLAKMLKEDRRIIANRTVQTRDLLAQNQTQESVIALLDGMITVARAGVEGDYGSYCQWYVNLRQTSASHQETINKMKALK